MNTLRKNVLIALTVLGMGTTAVAVQAQNAAPEARHGWASASPQERAAKMAEHFAKRQAKLHDALQLSGGQESAWAAYQASIRPDGSMMAAMGDRKAWAAFPEYRPYMLGNLYDENIWKTPELYDYAKQALTKLGSWDALQNRIVFGGVVLFTAYSGQVNWTVT